MSALITDYRLFSSSLLVLTIMSSNCDHYLFVDEFWLGTSNYFCRLEKILSSRCKACAVEGSYGVCFGLISFKELSGSPKSKWRKLLRQ